MNNDEVLARVSALRRLNEMDQAEKWRIRSIMNGGADGIYATMAWDLGKGASIAAGRGVAQEMGVDLPTVNLVASGNERFAQMISDVPALKAPIADDEDVEKYNQRRIDIVRGWDDDADLDLQYPQIGRWLPGYSFFMWRMTNRKDVYGRWYPYPELKDPYDVYPGWFGADQQPEEAAICRVVPLEALEYAYPEIDWDVTGEKIKRNRTSGGAITADARVSAERTRTWEGKATGVEVYEYVCGEGTYICIPEVENVVDYMANPLDSGPPFVFGKRFSYDRRVSQYHHVIGIQAMMAKLNVLGLVANEDAVFRPTNIYGEMISGTYEQGRDAVNDFEISARVERPTVDNQVGVWAQIDRLERMLRIGASYDVQQDSISPNSFATGAGMRELQGATNEHAREYMKVIRATQRKCDAMRLEWAEKLYGSQKRTYIDMAGKERSWRPSRDIRSDYRTRRTVGPLASFDQTNKLVMGLNLVNGEALSLESYQESIEGVDNPPLERQRITRRKAAQTLYARLAAKAEQDPRADAALVKIMKNPDDEDKILAELFTGEEPQPDPAEMAQMQAMMGAGGGAGPPQQEGIATVLARAESSGAAEAGVQRVGTL